MGRDSLGTLLGVQDILTSNCVTKFRLPDDGLDTLFTIVSLWLWVYCPSLMVISPSNTTISTCAMLEIDYIRNKAFDKLPTDQLTIKIEQFGSELVFEPHCFVRFPIPFSIPRSESKERNDIDNMAGLSDTRLLNFKP